MTRSSSDFTWMKTSIRNWLPPFACAVLIAKAVEARMLGKPDDEQLTYATSQGRCVMSFNVRDFLLLAQEWSRAGRAHTGIVVTPQGSRKAMGHLLRRILHLLNQTTVDEMDNVVRFL